MSMNRSAFLRSSLKAANLVRPSVNISIPLPPTGFILPLSAKVRASGLQWMSMLSYTGALRSGVGGTGIFLMLLVTEQEEVTSTMLSAMSAYLFNTPQR